jgi:hypothetical protein
LARSTGFLRSRFPRIISINHHPEIRDLLA